MPRMGMMKGKKISRTSERKRMMELERRVKSRRREVWREKLSQYKLGKNRGKGFS